MQMFFFFNPLMPRPLNVSLLSAGALQIENSEESDQGKYECVASNSAGTRYSAPANLYVRGKVKQSWVFKLWITPFTPVCWVQTQHLDNAVLLIRGIDQEIHHLSFSSIYWPYFSLTVYFHYY